jgi:four helix bundle protein
MFRFEELQIWKLAVDYAKDCYKIANSLPKYENYALADQLRRAAISISNNIAEGSAGSDANFKKYLNTAIGSTLETVNLINFACEIKYINQEIKSKLYSGAEELIKKIRSFSKSFD